MPSLDLESVTLIINLAQLKFFLFEIILILRYDRHNKVSLNTNCGFSVNGTSNSAITIFFSNLYGFRKRVEKTKENKNHVINIK